MQSILLLFLFHSFDPFLNWKSLKFKLILKFMQVGTSKVSRFSSLLSHGCCSWCTRNLKCNLEISCRNFINKYVKKMWTYRQPPYPQIILLHYWFLTHLLKIYCRKSLDLMIVDMPLNAAYFGSMLSGAQYLFISHIAWISDFPYVV
jgi:hypothetical protein